MIYSNLFVLKENVTLELYFVLQKFAQYFL